MSKNDATVAQAERQDELTRVRRAIAKLQAEFGDYDAALTASAGLQTSDVAGYLALGLVRRGWSTSSAHQYAVAAVDVLQLGYRIEAK